MFTATESGNSNGKQIWAAVEFPPFESRRMVMENHFATRRRTGLRIRALSTIYKHCRLILPVTFSSVLDRCVYLAKVFRSLKCRTG